VRIVQAVEAAGVETSESPSYLHDETSVFLGELDRLAWSEVMTVDLDGLHVGVRFSSPEVHELLQTALAPYLVDDDQTPANYSVLIGDGGRGRARGFHFLYRSSNAHLRTRDIRRVVAGLLGHLSSLRTSRYEGLIAVHACGLVGESGAAVAPLALRSLRSQVERRLNLRGIRYVDLPWVFLDPVRMEMVVPEPTVRVDAATLDAIATLAPTRRTDRPVTPGRYPITSWIFFGHDEQPLSRGQALAAVAQDAFTGAPAQRQETLDALAGVIRHVKPATVEWAKSVKLVDPIAEVMARA